MYVTWFLLAKLFYPVFILFLDDQLYFLSLTVMAQIFKATAELVIPTATPTNEAKTEIERDSNSNAAHFFMLFTH